MMEVSEMRFIDARTGEIRWNWNAVEDAHISYLYDRGEVGLRRLSERKAAEVVEYMAAHESINKAANACITLTDEEIELLTNYAELNGDEASYLRVLCFMLKEGLYDNCVLWLPMTRNLRAGINDTDTEVYDRSPFGNHGTIYGAVWQTLPSGKSALSFDGVDDYVEVPDSASLDITDAITVMVWVNGDLASLQKGILEKRDSTESGFALLSWKADEIRFEIPNIGLFIQKTGLESFRWYHVVGTYDSSTGKGYLYINGVEVGEGTASGAIKTNDARLFIGSRGIENRPSSYFNGTIDEVCIYSRALSEEEIRRLFNLTRVFYGV